MPQRCRLMRNYYNPGLCLVCIVALCSSKDVTDFQPIVWPASLLLLPLLQGHRANPATTISMPLVVPLLPEVPLSVRPGAYSSCTQFEAKLITSNNPSANHSLSMSVQHPPPEHALLSTPTPAYPPLPPAKTARLLLVLGLPTPTPHQHGKLSFSY